MLFILLLPFLQKTTLMGKNCHLLVTKCHVYIFSSVRCSYRDGWGDAERRESRVRRRQQVGGRRETLDEAAGWRQLPVLLGRTVARLPALRCHVAPETLHPVPHAGVEPAGPRQVPLRHAWTAREASKRGEAIELWGKKRGITTMTEKKAQY